ncbi:MAG TPA: ABC transporter ATP-binding protein [Candidatus Aminicenantes bacterium]|nr:ABC transporter ATP-binding protein [Candidatus Aminicenantes bacterium]
MAAIIEVQGLGKTYEVGSEKIHALRNITFTVRRGEFIAIMGQSGSGKSTLMNLLGCLDTPSEGKYFVNGREVSSLSEDELAHIRNQEIGFIFQVFHLLPRSTALHNVELPLIYSGMSKAGRLDTARRALEAVDLGDRMAHRPNELSGGQRQRVAIARALVNKPSLILADEPTGNLDSKTGDEIVAIFRGLHRQGNTIIMVTHNQELANLTERIFYLKDGEVVREEKRGG